METVTVDAQKPLQEEIVTKHPVCSNVLSYGLTTEEVAKRVAEGLVNGNLDIPTKSVGQIIRSNLFTLYNFVNVILATLVIIFGSFKNAMFLIIVVVNALLGIIQEVRAKRTIDKLSLISAPKVNVLRNGEKTGITTSEIVIDDMLLLSNGNQVCSDATVRLGEVEVDESMVTGESDPVVKHVGDELLSGSFIVSGNCQAQVIRIGMDNYAAKISNGARYIKKSNSEIQNSVAGIIKLVTAIMIPLALLLFPQQIFLSNQPLDSAVTVSVTAIISMMPQGLVLLTSMVFAASVIKLSVHNTLAQDLFCVETLARVDVLCLDKTGTITTGDMQVEKLHVMTEKYSEKELAAILSSVSDAIADSNPTAKAIDSYFQTPMNWRFASIIPFSSARKWSGVNFEHEGSFAFGAIEFMTDHVPAEVASVIARYSSEGKRVITFVQSEKPIVDNILGDSIVILAFIVISDQIRAEAKDTLRYFADQNVSLKIISGDNPVTVSRIAERAGLSGAENYVDASTLEDDTALQQALMEKTVFGRVTPQQKLSIVKLLRAQGHTVGMTGDGVNDVLALKEADCSVVMASGSDAARTVAQLVLLDNNFASMPKVVAEGRQSINNLQRSATLFLVKTIYAIVLALIILFFNKGYPFETIQLTLISTSTVGLPSILLALEPNKERLKGKFIHNALKKALPFSLTILITVLSGIFLADKYGLSVEQKKTLCSFILACNMFMVLFKVCSPFNIKRGVMFLALFGAFITCALSFAEFFSFVPFNKMMLITITAVVVCTYPLIVLSVYLIDKYLNKKRMERLNKLLELSNKIRIKY